MSQDIIFLQGPSGEESFGFVNLNLVAACRGEEPTEQFPMGSRTLFLFGGTQLTIDMPYVKFAETVAKHIKANYEFSAKWENARRDATGEMMSTVLRDVCGNHT